MKARIVILVVVVCGACAIASAAQDPYALAERLAAERQFERAEAEYRRQLEQRPRDWRLRLGLARVILWSGRYREAERRFAQLLSERPRGRDALLGHAQAAYWSGDFRQARVRYQRLLDVQPDHAEARQVLHDLGVLAAPRYEVTATHRDDTQPYQLSTARTVISFFSDPLTRWDLRAAAGGASGGNQMLGAIGAGFSAGLPVWRMSFEGWAERFTFPDGATDVIGAASISRSLPAQSAVVARLEKMPLLLTATSVDAHPSATQYTLSWRRDPTARWLAAVNAHAIDYSDGNRGSGADAWAMAPIVSRERFTIHGGASVAWRDTEQNRFRFTTFESEPIGAGEWAYSFTGVYDPYWTPHELKEARLIVAAESGRLRVQADAGVARDSALAFGPPTGFSPTPLFTFPVMIERSFRPWRVGVEWRVPLGERIEIRTRYRREKTVFYDANEFEASLGGRL